MKKEHEFDDALTLSRFLFDRAESALEEGSTYSVGLAVSLAQDAVETMLAVISRKLDAEVSKNAGFIKLWRDVKEAAGRDLPMSASMDNLNKGRVSFKHHGLILEESSARGLVGYAHDFLTQVSEEYLGIKWSEVSMADVISDDSIREHIKNAERELSDKKVMQCLDNCALAYGKIKAALDTHLPRLPLGIGYSTGTPQDEVLDLLFRMTDHLTLQLGRASLGINLRDALRFDSLVPLAMTSPPGGTTQFIDHGGAKPSVRDAQFCVRHITDMAIRLERRWVI